MSSRASIWHSSEFKSYLGTTGFSGMALAMQQLLVSWILIGILLLPADQVGFIQALIGVPGILVMLIGGASADRVDARWLLVKVYLFAPILPLYLVFVEQTSSLSVLTVTLFGLGMGIVSSYSTPAQQALLNRVSGSQVQEAVTAASAIGFVVQIVGLIIAGQMEVIGVSPVLIFQALSLSLAGLLMFRISQSRPPEKQTGSSAIQEIKAGLSATYRDKVILNVLSINFVSSIFNAGAFMTVYPFIIKRIYDGNAFTLAILMAIFFGGAALSNGLLLKFMPLKFPGRIFLVMQLSRIIVLFLLWLESSWWVLVVATIGWGLNMGITTNLARAIVQESAEKDYRGRIMSAFSVGMLGSAPIGAILLGWMTENYGTANALVPAMFVSFGLFLYGARYTTVWSYRSKIV